ncbi:hypothetical protein AB6D78_24465 [Vibrio splendidus]
MTERVKCKNKSCNAQILESTAEKNDGYCMPCIQRKEREARQRYIEQHRKTIDPYEGVTDPVELIKRYHENRPYDPLVEYKPLGYSIETVYQSLTEFDEYRLIKYSIQQVEDGNLDSIESICIGLVAFRSSNLSMLLNYMLKKKIYYPSILFKNSGSDTVRVLLNEVHSDQENRNLILLALAWANCKEVVSEFAIWRNCAPEWEDELYIPAYQYSKEAGWELDSSNRKRNLFYERCYPLVPAKSRPSASTCNTFTPSDHDCHWCGRPLTNLLEIDLTDSKFGFLGIQGQLLKITTCDVCASYSEAMYMEYDTLGHSRWSPYNVKPEYLPDEANEWESVPNMPLVISIEARPAHYAAYEFLPTTFSQVGGMPTWIQDASYPVCPCCKSTMLFLAQISNDEIDEHSEGVYYLYVCRNCKISAVNYQQT